MHSLQIAIAHGLGPLGFANGEDSVVVAHDHDVDFVRAVFARVGHEPARDPLDRTAECFWLGENGEPRSGREIRRQARARAPRTLASSGAILRRRGRAVRGPTKRIAEWRGRGRRHRREVSPMIQ